MPETLTTRSAIYWVILLMVALYSGISLVSFAKVIEAEQDNIIKGIEDIRRTGKPLIINNETTMKTARIKTTMGDITLELFTDTMPITTGNFIKLSEENFYDSTKFHRVISGFMIQGGDPNTKGDNTALYGTGGPGYTIKDEFVSGLSNVRGTISMANTGVPDSGGSQFFINLIDNTGLDFDKQPFSSKHPVFGKVIEGMDIVDAISKTPTNERDLPNTPVVIKDILIEER